MHGSPAEDSKRRRHMWPVPHSNATTVASNPSNAPDFFCKVYNPFSLSALLFCFRRFNGQFFLFFPLFFVPNFTSAFFYLSYHRFGFYCTVHLVKFCWGFLDFTGF